MVLRGRVSWDDAQQVAGVAGPWTLLLGVLVAGLYAILRGTLVPASQVDRLTAQWEARLAESHERELAWRQAYERTEEARDVNARQLGELMNLGQTTVALLRALPGPRGDHASTE
jgi:hypothetical protein